MDLVQPVAIVYSLSFNFNIYFGSQSLYIYIGPRHPVGNQVDFPRIVVAGIHIGDFAL